MTITRQYTGQTSLCPSGSGRWFFEFDHSAEKFRIGYDGGILSEWYNCEDIAALNVGGGAAADQFFYGCAVAEAALDGFPFLRIFTITELPS